MITRRINVRGIIFKNGQVFAQQLLPGHSGKAKDYWCLPGGGLEAGESLQQGLYREMVEETGVAPIIGDLLFIQQFDSDGSKYDEQIDFIFNIKNVDDYGTVDLKSTSHGALEIKVSEFIDPTKTNLLPKFLQQIKLSDYTDNDRPPLIVNNLQK